MVREEEAVKAKQFSIPDRLSSEQKCIFFIKVIWIQPMFLVAFIFINYKFTDYEVVSAGVCENAVSLPLQRSDLNRSGLLYAHKGHYPIAKNLSNGTIYARLCCNTQLIPEDRRGCGSGHDQNYVTAEPDSRIPSESERYIWQSRDKAPVSE
jgi:hypothetical protein